MALQAVSAAGSTYGAGGYVPVSPARALRLDSGVDVAGSLLRMDASRPFAMLADLYDSGGLIRTGADRPLRSLTVHYVSGGIISLENLRLLSPGLAAYVVDALTRANSARPLSAGYVLTTPLPPAPPRDLVAPVVSNYAPPAGTPITRNTAISFDVTEDSGAFLRVFVVAFFPESGITEVIHDGDGFRGFYASSSARRTIGGGFRYTVLRSGGWSSAPTIQTFAIDLAGNEN